MIQVRKREERGHADHGWLDTYHTFSFADYHDPDQMGFRALRVLNEDRVRAGQGFGTHAHRDMEILTYVLEGALEHRDSLGNGSVIRPGEVQRMSAGKGVLHSEHNHSVSEPVHFLQIWLLPHTRGLDPGYEQRSFPLRPGKLVPVASPEGGDGSLTIHADARLWVAAVEPASELSHRLAAGRHAWFQVARGRAALNGMPLRTSDGAAVSEEQDLVLAADESAEVLVFDLA